jgi:hypothetical protein
MFRYGLLTSDSSARRTSQLHRTCVRVPASNFDGQFKPERLAAVCRVARSVLWLQEVSRALTRMRMP